MRITSIAVMNLGAGIAESFSIHQAAEVARVTAEDIEGEYDTLERQMLDDFYSHVQQNSGVKWLHWNMRDSNYGFPAIAHRYRVLGGEPITPVADRLYDLASLLQDIFGPSYIGHPRLEELAKFNGMTMTSFLSGKEEARAFKNKEYVRLHQSTLRKVNLIANIARKQRMGLLKTKAKGSEVFGSHAVAIFEAVTDNIWFKLAGLVATPVALIQLALGLLG